MLLLIRKLQVVLDFITFLFSYFLISQTKKEISHDTTKKKKRRKKNLFRSEQIKNKRQGEENF